MLINTTSLKSIRNRSFLNVACFFVLLERKNGCYKIDVEGRDKKDGNHDINHTNHHHQNRRPTIISTVQYIVC